MFYGLDYIERNAVDRERKLLVFFVKSYYSILLYTYYDIITRNIETLHPVKKEDEEEIYKVESWFYTTNMMQRIVNGSYFTYKPGSLLKAKIPGYSEDVAADLLCLRGFQLHSMLTDLSQAMKDYESFDEKKKEEFQKQFRMAELIMLCISRRSYLNDEGEVEINRSRPNPYFVESFDTEVNFYVFDVLAPFVNLVNVKFTYDRFADIIPDMYEWAMKNDWSLLRQMMAKVVENDNSEKKSMHDYQEMRLVSDAIIRNAEILTMVKERLESLDNAHTDNATPAKVIAWYYNTITKNADVRTYDKTADGKFKRIGYKFLEVMANELNECDDERFTEIVFSYAAELIKNTQSADFDENLNLR